MTVKHQLGKVLKSTPSYQHPYVRGRNKRLKNIEVEDTSENNVEVTPENNAEVTSENNVDVASENNIEEHRELDQEGKQQKSNILLLS